MQWLIGAFFVNHLILLNRPWLCCQSAQLTLMSQTIAAHTTSEGLPCLPWSGKKMISDDMTSLFKNESAILEWRNFCRDPGLQGEGTFCYALNQTPVKKLEKKFCKLRKCKSQQCKMAGTGNDFIGQVSTTRSGRICDSCIISPSSVHSEYMYVFNDSYFADRAAKDARNFCRNPNRDVSGSWCYTKDPQVVQDVCIVKDCDRPEEVIVIVSTNQKGRKIFILPQWKEKGLHGGLKFSLKEWNPDLLAGLVFVFFPKEGSGELALVIGKDPIAQLKSVGSSCSGLFVDFRELLRLYRVLPIGCSPSDRTDPFLIRIYMKKAIGMHSLLESKEESFRKLRWFSVSSENAMAHWSFFCQPPHFAEPPMALLPECAINPNEPDYSGTQDVTSEGLPCLPWSGKKMISDDMTSLFKNQSAILEWRNFCRDPGLQGEGTFCYALNQTPVKKVEKKFCKLRKCKSQQCKMAGTGNDFIGQVSTTRSGRICDSWIISPSSVHSEYMYVFNDSYFADRAAKDARNFCRNPNRDVSGSWCYTKDPQVVQDVCIVKDCDRPEEVIVIVSTNQKGRKIFILPQWKEKGLHGGLKFSLKEWNPDLLAGLVFVFFPKEGSGELALVIGAEMNEKVVLFLNGEVIESKTFPHLISAGRWTDFWLQIRKGELMLGFKGVPTPLFDWFDKDDKSFDPLFMTYHSHYDNMPIGVFLQIDECHTENTTDNNFLKYFPIGLYSEQENKIYTNLSLKMRGSGQTWISLMWVTNNLNSIQIKLDTINGSIGLYMVKVLPKGTEPKITPLVEKQFPEVLTNNSWTKYYLTWSERVMDIKKNNVSVLNHKMPNPVLVYWFSVAAASGWVTWSANCEPLDLDGPPIDGGWSEWSPWTCTVTCGGGEGFRTRTCSNPHPNIFGKLCEGHPTASGVCNDFPCGDISPDTLDLIRDKLKIKAYSYIVDEDHPIVLNNDKEILKRVKKESPEAYYEWTKNGVFIKTDERVLFEGDDIIIKKVKPEDAGTYVSMIFRINNYRVVLKVLTLSVRALKFDVDTRATWDYSLQCHAVILGQRKDGTRKLTYLHRAMWRVEKGKKIEGAVKFYEESQGEHSTEFLALANQWVFLRSPDLVRLFGIVLKPMAMAMEYFNLGPLDQYLRDNRGIIKQEDLLEAAGCLAKALWDINEQDGIVHGRIRCRKLLVYCHEENRFRVKLSDPGVHTKYKDIEIHWLPPECYKTFDKRSTAADVWATATTFFEIFEFGEVFPVTDTQQTMRWYLRGNRLPKPRACPDMIYNVMMECWETDPHQRKQPPQLCRDVTQILFRVYNNRKKHWYAVPDNPRSETAMSTQSLISTKTAVTDISETAEISEMTDLSQLISQSENSSSEMQRSSSEDSLIYLKSASINSTSPPPSTTFESSFLGGMSSMQRIIEINDYINVTLIGIIGRGYYGKVFKGYWDNRQDNTTKVVAVKELNNSSSTNFPEEQAAAFLDFEREINIMQSLSHPNIVKILAVKRDPELHLIMEYIEHKSLLDYINITRNEITEKQLLKYALDIAMGMNYLGLQNIVHRDLAIRNVLVVDETTVKISDFGLAQCISRSCEYYYIQNPNKALPIKWQAPESLEHGKFSVKSDVWSYGVTLYEMFSLGEEPPLLGSPDAPEAQGQQKLLEALKDGIRYRCPKSCPQAIYVLLMIPCWQIDPDKRPTFLQLAATITDRLKQL